MKVPILNSPLGTLQLLNLVLRLDLWSWLNDWNLSSPGDSPWGEASRLHAPMGGTESRPPRPPLPSEGVCSGGSLASEDRRGFTFTLQAFTGGALGATPNGEPPVGSSSKTTAPPKFSWRSWVLSLSSIRTVGKLRIQC